MRFIIRLAKYKFVLVGIILIPIFISLKSVSAKNITINGLNKVEFGQGTSRAISCDPDGINLSLGSKYSSNGQNSAYYFSDFTISDISNNCVNKLFTIYFSDQDGNTIPNIAAKQNEPNISDVSFILRPVPNPMNPILFDSVQAEFPSSYVAVDYIPSTDFSLVTKEKKVKVSLDYHHFVPSIDVAYFAIEISQAEAVDRSETLVQSVPINCGSGQENIYVERSIDIINRKLIKSQLVPIPSACKGNWIKLTIRDPNATQVEINADYSNAALPDACNRQNFGSKNEITFYLPEQISPQPLLSGSTNSYSTFKVPLGNDTSAVYIDFPVEDAMDAWLGQVQIDVLPSVCEKRPGFPFYYSGY